MFNLTKYLKAKSAKPASKKKLSLRGGAKKASKKASKRGGAKRRMSRKVGGNPFLTW